MMNIPAPDFDLLHDHIENYDVNDQDGYFESIATYLKNNGNQIRPIFQKYTPLFGSQPTLYNFLKFVLYLVCKIGLPSFLALENSPIPDLDFDLQSNQKEAFELKRIFKYCHEKLLMIDLLHKIPRIAKKYQEVCQAITKSADILIPASTYFEQHYKKLSSQIETIQRDFEEVKTNLKDAHSPKLKEAIFKILDDLNSINIQKDDRYMRAENDLILSFFKDKYAIQSQIQNEYFEIASEYEIQKAERKGNNLKVDQSQGPKTIGQFKFFTEGESLARFPESMTLEYKDYYFPFRNEELRKKLKATICAFINTQGGRILIGISNQGSIIRGLHLTTNDQDELLREIDALTKEFHPRVEPDEVQTFFVPVKKVNEDEYLPGYYIVKIVVKRGKPNDLYFVGRDCYKRRNGKNEVQMPSNFKKEILERSMITIKDHPYLFSENEEYKDPTPEIGNPVLSSKGIFQKPLIQ